MKRKFGKSIFVCLLQKCFKPPILFINFERIVLNIYLTQNKRYFLQLALINLKKELLINSKSSFV